MKRFKIAFETQTAANIAAESMAIAQEGKIEQIKSFFQRAITTKQSMKKAIASLQGKEVKEVFEQEDGGKFSGFKLLDIRKVDAKAIIKYLILIKAERKKCFDICNDVFDIAGKATDLLKKDNSDATLGELIDEIKEIESTLDSTLVEFRAELKEHEIKTERRSSIDIESADQQDFDTIMKMFVELLDNKDFMEIFKKEEDIQYQYDDNLNYKYLKGGKIFNLALDISREAIDYMEKLFRFEDKFLFSLMKYLQASVK